MQDDQKPESVSLAEIEYKCTRIVELHRTIRYIVVGLVFLGALAIVATAIVKLADPPWVKVLLAIFGPSGLIAVLATIYLRYLRKKEDAATPKPTPNEGE